MVYLLRGSDRGVTKLVGLPSIWFVRRLSGARAIRLTPRCELIPLSKQEDRIKNTQCILGWGVYRCRQYQGGCVAVYTGVK